MGADRPFPPRPARRRRTRRAWLTSRVQRSGTGSEETPGGVDGWGRFADVVLQRAALAARVDRNVGPDPLAGLKVDDADLERLLAELPGLEQPATELTAAEVEAAFADQVEEARAALADGDDELAGVARRALLDPTELEMLAVLCAVELDPRRQRLVGYLHDDVGMRRLSAWTLGLLLGPAIAGRLGPGGRLRRAGLLERPVDAPVGTAALHPSPALIWWLLGDHSRDPDLPAGVVVATDLAGTPPPGDPRAAVPSRGRPLVVVSGPDRVRRHQAAAAALGAPSCLVGEVPHDDDGWAALVRAGTLGGHGVILEVGDKLAADARRHLERADHLAWALSSPADLPVDTLPMIAWRQVRVGDAAVGPAEWHRFAGERPPPPFPVTADQLDQIARAADAFGGDTTAAVRRIAAGRIDATATRIRPSRSWDDLVLDPLRLDQVRQICLRSRHRQRVFDEWGFASTPSSGVVALFAGPSGTGKTLAAEVVAADLGVDLYKIDLANLVSKYIGETEKNLSRVFDAAEASRVVLFFDEADALLSKRSDVSDAHDRYANIEVAYLLQRMERYEGVAVLATNLANNLDPAFLRRLHVVVEFALPEAAERRRIWERSFPPGAPLGSDLDLDAMARAVEVSGGTIRNAALGAAFLAADAGTPIGAGEVRAALRAELRKLGRLVDEVLPPDAGAPPGNRSPGRPATSRADTTRPGSGGRQ